MQSGGQNKAEGNSTQHRNLVLGCGALAHDLVRLIGNNPDLKKHIDIKCLPAKLHNTPQLIAPEVEKFLHKYAKHYDKLFVAYGDCGTVGALDKVLDKYGAKRLEGSHCYEFFSGKEAFTQITENEIGSFFLTDYLVKNFQRLVIEGLGLDRYPELFDDYFGHYKKMVYLAQTEDELLQQKAQKIANDFGLTFEYFFVGIDGLMPVVNYLTPSPQQ